MEEGAGMTFHIKICIILVIRRALKTGYKRISVQFKESSSTRWDTLISDFCFTLFFKITVTETVSGELD